VHLKKALAFVTALCFWIAAAVVCAQQAPVFKTPKEREGYAIGVDLARKFKRQGIDAETDAMLRGMRDVLSGGKLLMTEEDLQAALNEFQTNMKQKRARTLGYVAEENRRKGEAFLAANGAKEGVVALPSGLQYRVLQEGSGMKPTEADTVEVRYRGALIDGTEFDSSYRQGQPAIVKVAGLIPGWKEAMKLMPVGSRWQIFIPPDLAYREKGRTSGLRGTAPNYGQIIGPNEVLILEMELVAIR
jgi:FKBP-type peptidyl-prolyl cis-trans isomerase